MEVAKGRRVIQEKIMLLPVKGLQNAPFHFLFPLPTTNKIRGLKLFYFILGT